MLVRIEFRNDTASNWTSANRTLEAGEVGIESDTGSIKVGDGSTAWTSLSYIPTGTALTSSDLGVTAQNYSAVLTSIASNASITSGSLLVGNGSIFVESTASTTRTTLGTGAVATASSIEDVWSGTVGITSGGTGASDAATARTNLGLAIGTNVQAAGTYLVPADIGSTAQAYDSNLTSFVSTFTLPTSDSTDGTVLVTNGSGTLSFGEAGGLSVYETLPESPSDGDLAFSSGSLYIANGGTWYEMSGTLHIIAHFPGSNYGYTSGGKFPYSNIVDKFSFSTDGNATDVGDLTVARAVAAGQSSPTSGYTSGGAPSGTTVTNIIDKFPFSTDGNATDVGDLYVYRSYAAGQSSTTHGYTSGGSDPLQTNRNTIDKFPFATDTNATDIANLTADKSNITGQSSTTHGYTSGGSDPSGIINVIDKFPFSTDTNATDVGDLTLARAYPTGQSSATYGYNSGGTRSPGPVSPYYTNIIDKFPFATDTNATAVGDLTVGRSRSAGQSSTTYGYTSGGAEPAYSNIIDKFPYSTDANATDVGDLTAIRDGAAGQQY